MSGWITDFFRFWWALFYWNSRKLWFRLQGAHRDSCPCQNVSDSGLALDSRCEAVMHWRKPHRFRRVCPLLVETKEGWRCGVDAERVRPFWTRAMLYFSSALLGLYLIGTAALYTVLRVTDYDVRYRTIVWPPLWPELRGSQEKLLITRANSALAKGDFKAAILSLQTACELNPRNYAAGMALAGLLQTAGQPSVAEHVYARLMHDVPEKRPATAQTWVRSLLARGGFEQIKPMAIAMLSEDSGRREAWLHALIFAVRQTKDKETLQRFTENIHGLPDWCMELIRTEQLVLLNQLDQATPRLNRIHGGTAVSYVPYYQADRLLQLDRPEQASNLISAYGPRLPPDEAALLRIRAFRAKAWTSLLATEYDALLSYPLTPRLTALFTAALVENPTPELLTRFLDRFDHAGPSLDPDTLPHYNATYLAAALGGEQARADEIAAKISQLTGAESKTLQVLGELIMNKKSGDTYTRLMPLVPLPLEVIYAVHRRARPSAAP